MAEGPSIAPRLAGCTHSHRSGGASGAATMRPLVGAVGAAAESGISLERRGGSPARQRGAGAVARQQPSPSGRRTNAGQATARYVLRQRPIRHFTERLLASDSRGTFVDVVAASPAVTAAISEQGLGFADQVGGEMRTRSRRADDWLERSARRADPSASTRAAGTAGRNRAMSTLPDSPESETPVQGTPAVQAVPNVEAARAPGRARGETAFTLARPQG